MKYKLRINGDDYQQLKTHLLSNNGCEAVAVALCGRAFFNNISILTVNKVVLIPHEECECQEDYIYWKTTRLKPLLEHASKYDMGILKIHSHPGGYPNFSLQDDVSDQDLFSSIVGGWCESEHPHASAIMLPDGEIFGRVFLSDLSIAPLNSVMVVDEEIKIFQHLDTNKNEEHSVRTIQTFGEGTYKRLRQLKIGIVGCSGTGSIVIEELMRYCVGHLVLIDPDSIEEKNLNRLVNTKNNSSSLGKLKTEFYKNIIEETNLGTTVTAYPVNLYNSIDAIRDISTCDIIFGCVDSVSGRHLLNRISSFYLIPYFDIGVSIHADGKGGIEKIASSVNYLQPGKSSLLSRKSYSMKDCDSELMHIYNPKQYRQELREGYVKNVFVEKPAVISINSSISSFAVLEFLNRINPFKNEPPSSFSKVTIDLSENCIFNSPESDYQVDVNLKKYVGRGDMNPLLDMPLLSKLK